MLPLRDVSPAFAKLTYRPTTPRFTVSGGTLI